MKKLTKTQKVINYYLETKNVTRTAKKFNINRATVYSYLYMSGVKVKNSKS